jgi:hypothetical protein
MTESTPKCIQTLEDIQLDMFLEKDEVVVKVLAIGTHSRRGYFYLHAIRGVCPQGPVHWDKLLGWRVIPPVLPTDPDAMNREVTEAIFEAERLERSSLRDQIKAWERVERAEQALFDLLPRVDTSGIEFARRGVLSAQAQLGKLLAQLDPTAAPEPTPVPVLPSYDNALFYEVEGEPADALCHESPKEVLEEYLHNQRLGGTLRQVIQEEDQVTVEAYDRKVVTEGYIVMCAEGVVDDLEDSFHEEFGDPDPDPGGSTVFDPDVRATLLAEVQAAFSKALKATTVWQCEVVGERTYDEDELLEMFKREIEEDEKNG